MLDLSRDANSDNHQRNSVAASGDGEENISEENSIIRPNQQHNSSEESESEIIRQSYNSEKDDNSQATYTLTHE